MVAAEMMPMSDEMFVSAVRGSGDLAGVFEHDGDTAYFYLYDQSKPANERVIGAIHVCTGHPEFSESDLTICWTQDEEIVGLFILGQLWAAFGSGEKYGGNYQRGGCADIPESVADAFAAE